MGPEADDLPPPLFAHNEPGPRFTNKTALARMCGIGDDRLKVSHQFRGLVQRRLIQTRGKAGDGQTSATVFALADIAAAKVLIALLDLGLSDREIMEAASLSLYAWTAEAPKLAGSPPGAHPITAALVGTARGAWWIFRLDVYRGDQTGQRRIVCRCYDMDNAPPNSPELPAEMLPFATVTIQLAPMLMGVLGNRDAAG